MSCGDLITFLEMIFPFQEILFEKTRLKNKRSKAKKKYKPMHNFYYFIGEDYEA